MSWDWEQAQVHTVIFWQQKVWKKIKDAMYYIKIRIRIQFSNHAQVHLSSFWIALVVRMINAIKRFTFMWDTNLEINRGFVDLCWSKFFLFLMNRRKYVCSPYYTIHKWAMSCDGFIYIKARMVRCVRYVTPIQGSVNVGPILPHGQNKRPFGHVNRICVL